jgi:hypothetical protein
MPEKKKKNSFLLFLRASHSFEDNPRYPVSFFKTENFLNFPEMFLFQ